MTPGDRCLKFVRRSGAVRKLQIFGRDVSRESPTKLETQPRRVSDGETRVFPKVLGLRKDGLFPSVINLKLRGPSFRRRLPRNRVA